MNKTEWLVFGKICQNGKTIKQLSDETGLGYQFIKNTVTKWHKEHPELFPVESEKENMRSHTSINRRKKENLEVIGYSPKMDSQLKK